MIKGKIRCVNIFLIFVPDNNSIVVNIEMTMALTQVVFTTILLSL